MIKQNSKKRLTVVRWLLAALCLGMLALICTMGLSFARYAEKKEAYFAAEGAHFDVTADCVYDGATNTYVLQITNHSAVSVFYTLAKDGWPNGVTVTNAEGTLAPGETRTHTLKTTEEFLQIHEDILLDTITIEQILS